MFAAAVSVLLLIAAPPPDAPPVELRWGADLQGGEPYVSQDPADPQKLVGFEVDLANALAAKLGRSQRLVQADWSTLLQGLDRGTYDIAMNGVEATDARRDIACLTRPYYVFDLVLTTRTGDTARAPTKVGVLDSSQAMGVVNADPRYQAVLYQGVEEPYVDLQNGRIDAVLMDSLIERVYGRLPGLAVANPSVAQGHYVIAVAKAAEAFCRGVDQALAEVIADGTLRRILSDWKLWNPAQEALARPPTPPPAESSNARPVGFRVGHFVLFLKASGMTLLVSVLSMLLASAWGLLLASARAFGRKPIAWLGSAVVEIFRGTPVLLQLYVVYFGLAPVLTLSPLAAAILTLGLNYGAYEAEIYRGGLAAVSPRQWDAGLVLGMSRAQTFRFVVLPQAVRVALPGMANDFVALLKDSALVSVITVVELTKQMQITAVDVRSWLVPGAICAGLYLAMSLPVSWLGRALERRLAARGFGG